MTNPLPEIIRDFERVPADIVQQASEFQPAILADVAAEQAGGTQAVIDPDGWLRIVRPPQPGGEAAKEQALLTIIHDLQTHPIQQTQGVSHAHHH